MNITQDLFAMTVDMIDDIACFMNEPHIDLLIGALRSRISTKVL